VGSYGSDLATRASSPPPMSPQSLAVPISPPGTRPNSVAGDNRGSVVGNHVLRNSQRARLRKPEPRISRAGTGMQRLSISSADRRSRSSYGGEPPPPMDINLSREDLEGQIGSALSLPRAERGDDYDEHHHDEIVDHLDVIDPQVATMTNLSNAANSIFLPPLSVYSRRPVMNLPVREFGPGEKARYQDHLDEHVGDVLTRRQKIRRIGWGIRDFVSTPTGACTAFYGFLCAFWGAAIVLFLAKIINLHNKDLQNFWIEISSQVTNGLFTATGIGLIPWRVIDTYRMAKIWHYKRLTRQLRRKAGIQDLGDEDDLPDPAINPDFVRVLTEKQQDELHYQQQKFMASQTWYRPHATETHRAFPINTALLICLLIDGNSFFQCFLCGCMWGMNRFQRPAWTTGSLIPASFMCALVAAYFIFKGNNKTKKTKEVEGKLREALENTTD